jgi:uracil phosphoribosyltransferase
MPSQVVFELMNEVLDPALVRQDHLFMSRQTNAAGEVIGATWHDAKIGRDVGDRYVLFPDPMGATGSSMISALTYYKTRSRGSRRVHRDAPHRDARVHHQRARGPPRRR